MIINPYRFAVGTDSVPAPLHWWDLDDNTTTGGTGGRSDQGGGSNDMTLTSAGSPLVTADAPDGGNSLEFEAASEHLYTSSDFEWDGSGEAFSSSIWFKVETKSSSNNFLVSWRDAATNATDDRLFNIYVPNSTEVVDSFTFDNDETTPVLLPATGTTDVVPASPEWFHAVLTFDGVDTSRLYVNGTLEDTQTDAAFTNLESTNTMPFAIGTLSWARGTASQGHLGKVWACGIFDEQLDSDQIAHLYNSGTGRKFADLTID